jgi:two-component system, NtrC family, sensor kinase
MIEDGERPVRASDMMNILMVDDEPAKLLSYEVILGDLGVNLIKASSAAQAMSVLLKNDVAVVLMDVSMPEMDGFELADLIRQHPRFQKTAIIFISGVHLTDSDRIQGYRSGAVDYISVPVVPEVLRAKVSVFTELHRKTRQLERLNRELEQRVEDRTEELRNSEAQFRTRAKLLELASEAIMVRDGNDRVRFWNSGAESLYGWRRDEALGQDMHQLLGTVFPATRNEIEEALRSQGVWEGNLIQRTKEGKEIVVACRKTLNHVSDGVLEVGRDITSQLRAEEALRESEKLAAMGRVAGIIAHEINNPLAAITNLFFLLSAHPSLDEDARRLATMAELELFRVSHITKQTLSFYREAKRPISILVHELLDDVIALQERELKSCHIVLRKKFATSVPIHGFPVELRQVFMNLITNAIQAMQNGGQLRLHVREATDWTTQARGVAISITDTGAGISPGDAGHLFEPFFTTKSTKGTGLGLWISRGILQKYEGRISCRSLRHRDGCVTCFHVFIPVAGIANWIPSAEKEIEKPEPEYAPKTPGAEKQEDAVFSSVHRQDSVQSEQPRFQLR